MRLGYLVPEFPGQTHVMFWREIAELEGMGVEVDVVSTKPATRALESHAWSQQARNRTTYLTRDWRTADLIGIARLLASSRCLGLRSIATAVRESNADVRGRLPLVPLGLLAARLASIAQRRGWDHVHVHSCASSADIAFMSRGMGGPTYSLTLHGPMEDYGPNQSLKWGSASFGIAITAQLRSALRDSLRDSLRGPIPPILVVGMGVDVASMSRPTPYVPWRGTGPARVFSCGRLNPAKGHLRLIEAVDQLRATGMPVRLAIAGEDEAGGDGYRRVLQAAIVDQGLEESVTLLGAVSDSVVREHLHRADVFALASLSEPLGVAIMEAMAAGTPVVSTRSGGVPELIEHGNSGILVRPDDSAELAAALRLVLTEQTLALALSDAAQQSIGRRMTASTSARVLVEQVRRLISLSGSRSGERLDEGPLAETHEAVNGSPAGAT